MTYIYPLTLRKNSLILFSAMNNFILAYKTTKLPSKNSNFVLRMPKVSIIVPVYNCEQYLEECLLSILKQTFEDWECIIWSDGSTDNSLEIAKEFAKSDSRFSYGWSDRNEGLSAALNNAYSFAKGEYLCQVDADDILLPLALDATVEFLDYNPSIGLVYTDKFVIDEEKTKYEHHWGHKEHYSRVKLFYSFPLITHFRLMRREVLLTVGGYREEIKFAEDDDFAIRVAWGVHRNGQLVKAFKIQKLHDVCYLYRDRKGSMTQLPQEKNVIDENRELLKKKIFKFWRINIWLERLRWKIYELETGKKW